jgi:hypothetical protein
MPQRKNFLFAAGKHPLSTANKLYFLTAIDYMVFTNKTDVFFMGFSIDFDVVCLLF